MLCNQQLRNQGVGVSSLQEEGKNLRSQHEALGGEQEGGACREGSSAVLCGFLVKLREM